MAYPKRLIEVDLPIKRISAHARREKSIRHGHISTLHIWWARRPLAACRAVLCAALWPDPADELCPDSFRIVARTQMTVWAKEHLRLLSAESLPRFVAISKDERNLEELEELRAALLDFIADFANWDNSTVPEYLQTSRTLTQAAHEALGGASSTRPLVVDPFAGGGSIPLEALRVGADAFASDLNPVAVLLNKVMLEYIPKYGQRLADEVRKCGEWIKKEAEKELAEFYPKDPDGATPIAYLWARTIKCEGPGCGAEVPLLRSLWLEKGENRPASLQIVPNPKKGHVDFRIIVKQANEWVDQTDPRVKIANPVFDGTVKRGSATCSCCGYTTPVASVRTQLKERRGGACDARLMAVVTTHPGKQGRFYRQPSDADFKATHRAAEELRYRQSESRGDLAGMSLVPDEPISPNELRRISVPIYGMTTWGDLFSPRQALTLTTLTQLVGEAGEQMRGCADGQAGAGFVEAVQTSLGLAVSKHADANCANCTWRPTSVDIGHLFGRQAIGMVWDFAEVNPTSGATRDFGNGVEGVLKALESMHESFRLAGHVENASATHHPLPDGIAAAVITDPPYYDAVPYAYLSDFFYVWLRRTLAKVHPALFREAGVPKDGEIVVDRPHQLSRSSKGIDFYERELGKAFAESRRICRPDGIETIVFASKTTASWEAILKAVVDAGWIITGSWPIDTEMGSRVAAQGQARLASSVHLVCRPRENPDGSVRTDEVGDWRDVLAELPRRIHEWMPRLDKEGVVGADAIFACLGPALEIFSRYSRVEKASGEAVTLREYLEQVWAAVAKEALTMIFTGADATGFEEDARLTAMWLWTLHPGNGDGKPTEDAGEEEETDEEESGTGKKKATTGYALEYDAARKIAQGLGAHLEKLTDVVEVKGDTARLLSVAERTKALFGKEQAQAPTGKRKKTDKQMKLGFMAELEEAETASGGWGEKSVSKAGDTVLDRLHQAMIMFAAGRSEALRRFLVDDGIGRDQRFWKLADCLSKLYPMKSDEKRWVDGVLARKKGLGL